MEANTIINPIVRTISIIASRVSETLENAGYLIRAEFALDKEAFAKWLSAQTYTVLYHSQMMIDGLPIYAKAEKLFFTGENGAKHTEQDALDSLKKQGFEIPENWKEKKAYVRMVANQISILKVNSKLAKYPDTAIELSADYIYSAQFDDLKPKTEATSTTEK